MSTEPTAQGVVKRTLDLVTAHQDKLKDHTESLRKLGGQVEGLRQRLDGLTTIICHQGRQTSGTLEVVRTLSQQVREAIDLLLGNATLLCLDEGTGAILLQVDQRTMSQVRKAWTSSPWSRQTEPLPSDSGPRRRRKHVARG